jgi:acetoacetate decarboxylase
MTPARRAFAMPPTSPAYPPGPYRFINREYLIRLRWFTWRARLDINRIASCGLRGDVRFGEVAMVGWTAQMGVLQSAPQLRERLLLRIGT